MDSEQEPLLPQMEPKADWTSEVDGFAVALAPMNWAVALMMGLVQDWRLASSLKAVRNVLQPSEMPLGMRGWS